MPFDGGYYYENLSPILDAWAAHYEAKGCTPEKARDVAHRKVDRGCRHLPGAR